MDIPDVCREWARSMGSGRNGEPRILSNLEREKCIDKDTWDEFFRLLAQKGRPSNVAEARRWAEEVIQRNRAEFTCRGHEIPEQLFVLLFRLEDLKALRWRIPDSLKKLGIVDEELIKGLPEEELLSVTDEHKGVVRLGGVLGFVWAADYQEVENLLDHLDQVIDRVGLRNLVNEDRCVLCVYAKSDINKSLHLPRSFDGINNSQFDLVEDCAADAGKTLPLTSPREQGLPEAVHRECEIIPKQWKLRLLK